MKQLLYVALSLTTVLSTASAVIIPSDNIENTLSFNAAKLTTNVNRYIILFNPKYENGLTEAEKTTKKQKLPFDDIHAERLIKSQGGRVIKHLQGVNATVAELTKDQKGILEQNSQIQLIEPDPKRSLQAFAESETTPYGLSMIQADQLSDNLVGDVKVCIIDTGYDVGHEDLPTGANITGEVVNNLTESVDLGSWSTDSYGHGTHVAGTISALGGNHLGSVGVLPSGQIKLHIVKVIHNSNYWEIWGSDLIEAVNRCETAGANIINISLAGTDSAVSEQLAMDNAYAAGTLLVGAAGNRGNNTLYYPASYESVLSVGAVDENESVYTYSQFNSAIDLVAPGVSIYSTLPGNKYSRWDGTSYATAYVSGVAALVWGGVDCTQNELRQVLTETAKDLGNSGKDDSYGHGLVQAKAAADKIAVSGCGEAPAPAPIAVVYTEIEDFVEGTLINLNTSVPGQVSLNDETEAFDFIWMAASSRGTIIKINTLNGEILGEYLSSPTGHGRNPSRTTVEATGGVWATNRADTNGKGSVIHIGLEENNQCVDRNGNGVIDTSIGLSDIKTWPNNGDGNGVVEHAVDECIVHYTLVNGTGARHVSIDTDNNVWVGGRSNKKFDLLDGLTGKIIRSENSVGYGGYGGLTDGNGVIWSARPLLRWDPSNPLEGSNGTNWEGYSHDSYGLCIDSRGNVYNTSLNGGTIHKFHRTGLLLESFSHGNAYAQGCTVDANDHIWVTHSILAGGQTTVGHLDQFGNYIGNVTLPGGRGPTGIAVDAAGKIWVTNRDTNNASRIDPNKGAVGNNGVLIGEVDLTVNLGAGAGPYNYSDMTGSTVIAPPPTGVFTIVHDSGAVGEGVNKTVGWLADEPGNSQVKVLASASADGQVFGATQVITDGIEMTDMPERFIKLEVTFARSTETVNEVGVGESPILYEFEVQTPQN